MGETVIMIPCRMASKRLPGKPMLDVNGRPLVRWTYDRAKLCKEADHVLVASPDREICRYCQDNGMMWRPTMASHPTGTHRCAEVLAQIDKSDRAEVDVVVNWQVDEPLVDPVDVDRLIRVVRNTMPVRKAHRDGYVFEVSEIATLMASFPTDVESSCEFADMPATINQQLDVLATSAKKANSTDVVKVVSSGGQAHWFSRSYITKGNQHIGVYAFRAQTLRHLGRLGSTLLSEAESLEQLAWLEAGWRIDVIERTDNRAPLLGINTPEDLEMFKAIIQEPPNEDG